MTGGGCARVGGEGWLDLDRADESSFSSCRDRDRESEDPATCTLTPLPPLTHRVILLPVNM